MITTNTPTNPLPTPLPTNTLSVAPASVAPASVAPASAAPASVAPASAAPASVAPASAAPASAAPASVAPASAAAHTASSHTAAPSPATPRPATPRPATSRPATSRPATSRPATSRPATPHAASAHNSLAPAAPPLTATEAVFEKLLADIVGGTYPAGARLPAERDLAKQLGASRPTLREALRRLGEWNLVKPRRGSGIAVQGVSDWMIDVLPSYLRYAEPGPEAPSTPIMVRDLLRLRRSLMREILAMVIGRVRPEATAKARIVVREGWENRSTGARSATADLDVLRSIVESAKCLPGLWMLNQMSAIYNDLAKSLGAVLAPPESFIAAWDSVLDALEQQNSEEAIRRMNQYLEGHDERLMALLELLQ